MSGVATAIGVGTAAVSAGVSAYGANKASKAQGKASRSAIAEQQRQYDRTRKDQMPWLKVGGNALARLSAASRGSLSGFRAAPDYKFVRAEGQRDIGNSFAARGGAFGGNALRALTEFNQKTANQYYGDWWNRQAGLAGVGQNAANSLGQFGANAASNIGQAQMYGGDARASGIVGATNALTSGLSSGVNTWLYNRQPQRASLANNYNGPKYGGSA